MALPHAVDPDLVADDNAVGEGLEVGHGPVLEQVAALKGGAGEHEDVDAPLLEGAAGGGAYGVVEHGAVHRQHGLLDVVLRHGPAGLGEEGADGLQNVLMELQLPAEGGADGLLGEVVIGGPQAAGGDDDVRPCLGDIQGVPEPLGVVPHYGVVVDGDAQGAETLGEDLGVGVGDVAQEQLGADGNEFCGVCHGDAPHFFLVFCCCWLLLVVRKRRFSRALRENLAGDGPEGGLSPISLPENLWYNRAVRPLEKNKKFSCSR